MLEEFRLINYHLLLGVPKRNTSMIESQTKENVSVGDIKFV